MADPKQPQARPERSGAKIYEKIVGIALVAMVSVQSWQTMRIIDIEIWRAETNANRFTMHDWQEQGDEIKMMITDLRQEVALLPKKDEIPPPWFYREHLEVKQKLEAHIKEANDYRRRSR